MNIRTYHDPLHKGIRLNKNNPEEEMVMNLIDSLPFQRLRRIRQLGPAYLTFHGAESSRFTHSLGVFEIARRAINHLLSLDPNLKKYIGLLYASALLHDLGHGPLSHTSEEIYGIEHESWTARLVREHPEINKPLEDLAKGTSNEVAKLIEKGDCNSGIIKSLISSQLDCDRLDYLLRDSYSTGTNYGNLDLERIIRSLTIAPDGELAIDPKGLMAVEHYLVVRNLMYRSVYNHRLNEVCNWLLEKIIKTAREIGNKLIWTDEFMHKWIWENEKLDIETFLANDDIRTTYHIMRWQEDSPKPLKNLCHRFLNRKLLKALSIDNLNNEAKLELFAKAIKLAEDVGIEPEFSCGIRNQKLHSYSPYIGGMRLWDGEQLQGLEKLSPLIKSLINPSASSWLIYPKEIDEELRKELKIMNYKF